LLELTSKANFTPSLDRPKDEEQPCCWFIFRQGGCLFNLIDQQPQIITLTANIEQLRNHLASDVLYWHFLGYYGHWPCFTAAVSDAYQPPSGMAFYGLRALLALASNQMMLLLGRAKQITYWQQNHRFCSRCGSPTYTSVKERVKVCYQCGNRQYPQLSPCVIVLVTKNKQVLLARAARHPTGRYSTLAGYVEPGETVEQALVREVYEETAIRVTDCRYFTSQPWPFPNNLMLGFFAQYQSGDIVVAQDELEDARWWPVDQLPEIPPKGTIARALIDAYCAEVRN
jgi:NAD+ diphosphatase